MTAAPAVADEPPPPGTAVVTQVVPVVVATAQNAVVQFHYVCSGGNQNHLFVAVKQGPEVNTTDHSSSDFADTFYSTNWSVDQGPNALVCDGKRHLMRAQLTPDAYFAAANPDAPALSSGPAFVQICLFDVTGLTTNYTMKRVIATQTHKS